MFAMNDRIYYRPAIPLLIALMGGLLLGSQIPGYAIGVGVLAVVCAGLNLLLLLRRQAGRLIPIWLFFFLGYLAIQPWLDPRIPSNHIIHYSNTHRWTIVGQIDTPPWQIKNRTRFDLQVAFLEGDHETHGVTGLLRVTAAGNLPNIGIGDQIRFKSRMRSIVNFNNPGRFDYKRHMAFKGIHATAYVKGDRITVIDKYAPAVLSGMLNDIRGTFARLVEKSGYPEVQGILKALIIGDRTRISNETRQDFNRAGVGHLLAISGLHIGIVATVAFALAHWLMTWIKPLLWRAWTRKAAALLSLLPVIAYGVVAGLSPSTQRAVIMVSIFLMTFLFAKEQDSLNTLALAALVILIVDPPSLFSISFQLSFITVFAIIYGFSCRPDRGSRQAVLSKDNWARRLLTRLVSFFLVSFFAICGSLPLVAYYFNQISLVGLAANFLVVPLVGFVAIPLGLVALFVSPLSPLAGAWCIKACAVTLGYALEIVRFFAELPFAAVKTFTPSTLEIVCFYILGWALLKLLRAQPAAAAGLPDTAAEIANNDTGRLSGSPSAETGILGRPYNFFKGFAGRGLLPGQLAKAAVILVFLVLAADTCYWLYQRFWHPDLRVTVIDVGTGSASLLEYPGGYTILIDGGGFADNSSFDVGASIIAPFLWSKKIRSVDLLILSHPNSDHLNGLIYIAEYFNVKTVWTNNEPHNTLGYRKFMEVCARRKIFSPIYARMTRKHVIRGVQLDLLYPPQDFMDRKKSDKWRNLNNNSLVAKVSFGAISFLFSGDIMAAAERELVNLAGGQLRSMVLIAPHHGSRSSSSKVFLNGVNPEMVIVSCGRNTRFKFPHPEVLKRYKDLGAAIFRTDLNGAVRLSTNGKQLTVNSFKP